MSGRGPVRRKIGSRRRGRKRSRRRHHLSVSAVGIESVPDRRAAVPDTSVATAATDTVIAEIEVSVADGGGDGCVRSWTSTILMELLPEKVSDVTAPAKRRSPAPTVFISLLLRSAALFPPARRLIFWETSRKIARETDRLISHREIKSVHMGVEYAPGSTPSRGPAAACSPARILVRPDHGSSRRRARPAPGPAPSSPRASRRSSGRR